MSRTADRERLVSDLKWVAGQTPRNAFKQAGDEAEANRPTLARVVQSVAGEAQWHASPAEALIHVLGRAIDRLPREFTGRLPRRAHGDCLWKGQPERHMAELLYGYRNAEIPARYNTDGSKARRTYSGDYRPAALRLVDLDKPGDGSSFNRVVLVIREDLADRLLDMEREAIERRNSDIAITATGSPGYVARQQLEDELRAVVACYGATGGLVLLYGEGGMGKSRLAREYVKDSDHIVVDLGDAKSLPDAILDAIETLSGSDLAGTPMRRLRKLLGGGEGPQYLVLDDVDDKKQLLELLPEQVMHTIVIATARRNILPPDCGVAIKVGPMLPTEAHALLLERHPSLTVEQLRHLNSVLRGHTLALVQTAAYLHKYPMIADEFSRALPENTAAVLADLPVESPNAALHAIYGQVIDSLAGRTSLELLKVMAFSLPLSVKPFLEEVIRCHSKLGVTYPALVGAKTAEALEELTDLCLVEWHGDWVSMHPLTHAILRDLMRNDAESILNDIIRLSPAALNYAVSLTTSLMHTMGEDFYRDSETHQANPGAINPWWEATGLLHIRRLTSILSNTEEEAKRLRAEMFPTPQYREAFRQALQAMFSGCFVNYDSRPLRSLQQYITWFMAWATDHGFPHDYRFVEDTRIASQEAIDHFMPNPADG